MSAMYDAMVRAGKTNPEFLKEVEDAKQRVEEQKIQEELSAAERIRIAEAEAARVRELELQRNEWKRRGKEASLMATNIPYIFSFPFMGAYSSRTVLLLAKDQVEAREKAWKIVDEFIHSEGFDQYTAETFKKRNITKETLPIIQIDLSEGFYTVSEYYE